MKKQLLGSAGHAAYPIGHVSRSFGSLWNKEETFGKVADCRRRVIAWWRPRAHVSTLPATERCRVRPVLATARHAQDYFADRWRYNERHLFSYDFIKTRHYEKTSRKFYFGVLGWGVNRRLC